MFYDFSAILQIMLLILIDFCYYYNIFNTTITGDREKACLHKLAKTFHLAEIT